MAEIFKHFRGPVLFGLILPYTAGFRQRDDFGIAMSA
jgi:hypothetical protein